MKTTLAIILAVTAAVPAQAQEVPASAPVATPAPANSAAAAASPAMTAVPAPPEGMGQIVFFRGGGMGFAMGCGVNENGERVSALGAGRYFVHPTSAGSHTYTAKSEATDTLTIDVVPGATSYVRCTIKMGIMAGRPNLTLTTADDFAKASGRLKPVDADDMGPKPKKS